MPSLSPAGVSKAAIMFAALVAPIALSVPLKAGKDADAIVLDTRRYDVLSGRFSTFSDFQSRLQTLLTECGKGEDELAAKGQKPSGRIGADTRRAIQRLLTCPVAAKIPKGSLARQGVITEQLWHIVMNGADLPTVQERAQALVLSFEATDFSDAPEWNLCEDGTAKGARGELVCYNASDPCSYLTWGPRGATAGAGREIQFILWKIHKKDPDLLKRVFGSEYAFLARFFRLKAGIKDRCDGAMPLKVFMCAIWMDPKRRAIWDKALAQLGDEPSVREAYQALYAAREFDGGKLDEFYELWAALGLAPSQVDYAFFLDRATHLGGPPDTTAATVEKMTQCARAQVGSLSRHGSMRRCLSQLQPHKTQQNHRLARDVAYYLDAYREGTLDEREINAWARYVPLSAVYNFGLKDEVAEKLGPASSLASMGVDLPAGTATDVTAEEMASCPASVIRPLRGKP